MKHSLFISDLHLCPTRPHVTRQFQSFMRETAPGAEALYVLGDLFEYWAGDDDLDDSFNQSIARTFSELSQRGTQIYLMHGNRDFLLGQSFAKAAGASLLPDPTLIDLYGTATLLSHGDALCTDDTDYQTFRSKVRSAQWQADFLRTPLAQRKAMIEDLRRKSEQEKQLKPSAIMDVNPDAVKALLLQHHTPPRLIHGHTHRPARHMLTISAEVEGERWVLPAWEERGGFLSCSAEGCTAFQHAN